MKRDKLSLVCQLGARELEIRRNGLSRVIVSPLDGQAFSKVRTVLAETSIGLAKRGFARNIAISQFRNFAICRGIFAADAAIVNHLFANYLQIIFTIVVDRISLPYEKQSKSVPVRSSLMKIDLHKKRKKKRGNEIKDLDYSKEKRNARGTAESSS